VTIAPDTPRLAFESLGDAVEAMRKRGLRLTTSRRLVLEALFAAEGPMSAEHITRQLNLDPTSVYRNLETLEHHGLVRHVHLGHGPGLYVLVGRGEREYLYCERCGAVRALTPEELDPVRDRLRKQFGYEARFTHFPIVGVCVACAEKDPRPQMHKHADGVLHAHPEAAHGHEHSH
jgi:Fur family ferric uptake transcriptional regulator